MPEVRPLRSDELDAAHACYRRNEYTGTIHPEDDPLVAVTDDGAIVGVVRIAHEQGVQILRGMFLDEAHRERGLGTRMITMLAERMRPEPCWVICGPHLIRFYGRIGFRLTADEEAPAFLQERVAHYRDTYGPQCLLRRPA
ncbi:MAG: GNAT family N-acetyltransferase [Planctomycetota bacterium]|nr:GNAT family N-acetyltransferase [Planctomycetota bacterium]